MLFEQRRTRGLLRGLVRRLAAEPAVREDLFQEAVIHLWQREKEHPGQSQSWYIQSCWLHLQNHLRKGRSVDSGKHGWTALLTVEADEGREAQAGEDGEVQADEDREEIEAGIPDTLFAQVCARDVISELSKWLTPVEKQILNLGFEGLSSRGIALRLGLSHTTVVKQRHNIARLASWSGLVEPPPATLGRATGSLKPNNPFLQVPFPTKAAA